MNSLLLLLSMSPTNLSLYPDIFSSIVDKSLIFNKIAPIENAQKVGENGFSRSHNF
jgi:hypothetical protein